MLVPLQINSLPDYPSKCTTSIDTQMSDKPVGGVKNLLTLSQSIAYCISDIIGSGIFISPTGILKYSKTSYLSLLIWILAGLISLFGALIYIEFATIVKKSGGDFAYLTFVGWYPLATAFFFVGSLLTYSSILAIQTYAIGYYLTDGITSFLSFNPESLTLIRHLLGYSILLPTIFLNLFSLRKSAGRFQLMATIIKILIVSFVIVSGIVYWCRHGSKNGAFKADNFFNETTSMGDIVLATYSGLYSYTGWSILTVGVEEVENPKRTLPIATFIGLAVAAIVYLLVNTAYFLVLTSEEFQSTDVVVTLFFQKIIGSSFSHAVPFLITFILIGSLNASIFGGSRYLFVGSRAGIMPSMFSSLHCQSGSPRAAVMAQLVLSVIMSFIGNLNDLISYASYAMSLQQATVLLALVYLRLKMEAPKDAWRNPWFVLVIYFGVSLALVIIPLLPENGKVDYFIAVYAVGLIFGGLIAHYVIIRPTNLPSFLKILDHRLLVLTQIIFDTDVPA